MRQGQGHEVMGIKTYIDLVSLLGKCWYIRILNPRMNFCYVNRETVQFWIHKRRDIEEYDEDGVPILHKSGYNLVFKFVGMDGVADDLASILQLQ